MWNSQTYFPSLAPTYQLNSVSSTKSMRNYLKSIAIVLLIALPGCSTSNTEDRTDFMDEAPTELQVIADVISVDVSSSFVFSVGIKSPDTGCDQYANWWEILTPDGTLLYRRILAHSHITEQPFIRSGGPVDITETTEVYIRAHMHPSGYGGAAYKGTVQSGFTAFELESDFAEELASHQPLPSNCTG